MIAVAVFDALTSAVVNRRTGSGTTEQIVSEKIAISSSHNLATTGALKLKILSVR